MIKKILLTLFLVLVQTAVFSQKTYTGASGNWNIANNWTPSGVPTSTDDVTIPSGKTVTIGVNAEAKSISVIGTGILIVNDGITLTVKGSVIVDNGASFNAGTGNNDSATIKVFGDFINQGSANFWKSTVVIAGNLITASTILQNNGNIIVGGNVSGVIGGSGSGIVYPVNPNSTVVVTGNATEQPAGTLPTNSTLLTLMYEVIYGGSCSFTVNDIANMRACPGANVVFSVATTATAPNYLWQVNTSGSGWVDLANGPTYSGVDSSTLTITGVTLGMNNYRYRAKIISGSPSCVKNGNYGVLTISTGSTTWNGSAWSNGIPAGGSSIIFTGTYPPAVDPNVNLSGCSCLVSGAAVVTIRSGRTLTVVNEVNVATSAALIFENSASLVQTNDAAVNVGNITYKRLTNTPVRNTDYTYWSTPVSPLNLGGTGGISYNPSSLVGSIFYSYEVTAGFEDWKGESATSPMIVGKGYSIRGPGPISYSPISQLEATFTGTPNNGPYPITGINPFKSYLLGNPYPSALDADKFLRDNAGVIDGTLYFWTHSTKIGIGVVNPGTGVYAYSGDDYASYNLTGGVGTDGVAYPQGGVQAPSSPGFKPTGKIGAGQGFFATSNTTIKGTNEIVFNNSMRVGVGGITGNNSQFFKTNSTKSKTTSAIEKNRVWLNLTNTQGAFKQLLVGYITGATNDYDNGYDGETFDGNEFLDFYSVNQDKNFVIQGRALPFDVNDEVSLGYRSVAAGDFSIGIDEVDGVILSQKVFIEDKLLNVAHDLKASPYDFTTQAGTFNDRFVLHYKDKTLGADDFDKTENQVLISKDKNDLKIKSELENIKRITVFDLFGRKVFDKEAINSNEFSISNSTLNKQIVIVKVILANGNVISKKVIY
mgnify:CR=1 FL=1